MTWKPTDEMRKAAEDAAYEALEAVCGHCNAGCGMATLIAVQPLIAAEERERMLAAQVKMDANADVIRPHIAAEAVRGFAKAVLHGDDVHREWLLEAAEAYATGQPLPPARSKPPEAA